MFNIASKYFSFFNYTSPASLVACIIRNCLPCYSCLYYHSITAQNAPENVPKGEHLWNNEKYFLFYFESSFRSWWRHQMPKRETRNTFYWITWEVNQVWQWNLVSLCNITKKKKNQNFYRNCRLETSSRPFLLFKEFSVKRYLGGQSAVWADFDSFANTYLI